MLHDFMIYLSITVKCFWPAISLMKSCFVFPHRVIFMVREGTIPENFSPPIMCLLWLKIFKETAFLGICFETKDRVSQSFVYQKDKACTFD